MTSTSQEHEYWRQLERDYYVLLGVPRDATTEEIRAKFLILSREFHPDRVQKRADGANLVSLANAQYPILDRAYKVLSNPTTRHVYNIYGERGVKALEQAESSSEPMYTRGVVGTHLKSQQQMQKDVERVLRRLNEQALDAQFASFSELNMGVDASDAVAYPMRALSSLFRTDRRFINRTDMTIHQRTTFPLSRTTKWTLGGYMYDKGGLGIGCLTSRLEYTSPDPSIPSCAIYSEVGWTPKLHVQLTQPISPYTAVMWIPELDAHGLDMSFGINHVLHPELHGAMMYSTRDGMSINLSNDTPMAHNSLGVAVSAFGGVSLSLALRRTIAALTNVKASIRANVVTGLSLALGGSKQISHRTRAAMSVMVANAGVTLRIGFTRGSVRFIVPIFVSPFSVQTAFSTFCLATTPMLFNALLHQWVRPSQVRKQVQLLERQQETRNHYISSARRCAMTQQKLMKRVALEKRQLGGLVILLARYGHNPTSSTPLMPSGTSVTWNEDGQSTVATDEDVEGLQEQWIDVTIPMQFFVQDVSLTLPGTSKASLLGFYNPCVGLVSLKEDFNLGPKPQLYVRYTYGNQVFEATFEDDQRVELPSRYAQHMGQANVVY